MGLDICCRTEVAPLYNKGEGDALRRLLCLGFVLMFGTHAQARDGHLKVGVLGGVYLPANVPGVTEVMKGTGARVAWFEHVIGLELWGYRAVEKGSVVNFYGVSMITGFEIPAFPEMEILVWAGPSWARLTGRGNPRPETNTNGFHYGGGALLSISEAWSFRTGFTMLNVPGRSLVVELGLEWRFAALGGS